MLGDNKRPDPDRLSQCSHTADATSSVASLESLESAEDDAEKTKPSAKKMKTDSDTVKSDNNTAWEKTKEVGENVKEGIAKSFEKALGSVASCVRPGEYDADGGGGNISMVNDGPTETSDDIKNKSDDTLEESKEYPDADVLDDLNIALTEQKMESVKRDLDKIMNSVEIKCKISKKDNGNGYVVKERNILIKGELPIDAAHQNLRDITKSVKEVKEKCKSAVENLPESLV